MKFISNTEIMKTTLELLSTRGIRVHGPENLREDVVKLRKEIKDAPVRKSGSSFSIEDYYKWKSGQEQKIEEKLILAAELEEKFELLRENSGSCILWYDGRLYFDPGYILAMLEIAKKNAVGIPSGFGVIGGTANNYMSKDRMATMRDYINDIIPAINKFVELGRLHMVSLPAKVEEYENFLEPARIMLKELDPRVIFRDSLIGATKDELAEVAGMKTIDRYYDQYCPHIGAMDFQAEYLNAAINSALAGFNQSITSMLRFPYDANSPERIITFAAAGLLAMVAIHMTINPKMKILSGVMPAAVAREDANKYVLRWSWLLNAAWGGFVKFLGIDAVLSVGTGTNEIVRSEVVDSDNASLYRFFKKFTPAQLVRHLIGYLNLDIFHLDKFREDMKEGRYPSAEGVEAEEIMIPGDDINILDLLDGPQDEWSWEIYYARHKHLDIMSAWEEKYKNSF